MTDRTPTERTRTDAATPPRVLRPYVAPVLTPLGAVGDRTAGPDSGAMDGIFGGSGGFQRTDGTS